MIGVAVENPATGVNSGDEVEYGEVQARFFILLTMMGRPYHGFITDQRLMIVEFLKKCPFVDNARIAVSGLSLGCGGVLYSALMSDDVSAAVYNDFVCSLRQRLLSATEVASGPSLPSDWLPGGIEWFDIQPDLMAAVAPKPLLLAEGGPWKGHLEKIVRAYRMAGAEDKLAIRYYRRYQDPASRLHEEESLSEITGLTMEEYLEYANVDAQQHSFHAEVAVPWLMDVYGMGAPSDFLKRELEKAVNEPPTKFV